MLDSHLSHTSNSCLTNMAKHSTEKVMEEVEVGSSFDSESGPKTGEVLQRQLTQEFGQVVKHMTGLISRAAVS